MISGKFHCKKQKTKLYSQFIYHYYNGLKNENKQSVAEKTLKIVITVCNSLAIL